MLVEAYNKLALSETTWKEWFRRFKLRDFDRNDKECPGQQQKFEDTELQALVDKDLCQISAISKSTAETLNITQVAIFKRLKAMEKVYNEGQWVPYELKERDIERRKTISEMLLARQNRKRFLHQIVTGDEK